VAESQSFGRHTPAIIASRRRHCDFCLCAAAVRCVHFTSPGAHPLGGGFYFERNRQFYFLSFAIISREDSMLRLMTPLLFSKVISRTRTSSSRLTMSRRLITLLNNKVSSPQHGILPTDYRESSGNKIDGSFQSKIHRRVDGAGEVKWTQRTAGAQRQKSQCLPA